MFNYCSNSTRIALNLLKPHTKNLFSNQTSPVIEFRNLGNFLLVRSMSSIPTKVFKAQPTIGTHDLTFHCDDVTACFMLKQLLRFKDHEIIRTRDQEKLDACEIIVDVGSVLDVDQLRLDHHQRTFQQTIHDYHPQLRTTNLNKPPRLSSSGLVYSIFGKQLLIELLGNADKDYKDLGEDEKNKIDAIYEKAYVEFFEEIDAIDNGVEIVSGDNLVYNYSINSGISNRVGRLNPKNKNATGEERLVLFKKAMELVGNEILEGIDYLATTWWPQQIKFYEIVKNRKEFDPSGQIVKLDIDQLDGWKSAFFRIERDLGIVGELKYIIFHNKSDASPWRATAMPVSLNSFQSRVPFLKEWCGKRDDELVESCGIPGASFVHMNGFTGGARTFEAITGMVKKTLGI